MSTHSNPEVVPAQGTATPRAQEPSVPDYPDYLDLEGYRFLRRREEEKIYWDPRVRQLRQRTEYFLEAELTRKSSRCIFCGDEGHLKVINSRRQSIHDRPIGKTPCTIEVDRAYFRCTSESCKQRWSEPLPHLDGKHNMTDRLRDRVWDDSKEKSHTLISLETGLDEKTIRGIIRDGIAALDRTRRIQLPAHLFLDDFNLSPKKRYKGLDAAIPLKERVRAVCGNGQLKRLIEVFKQLDIVLFIRFFDQFTTTELAAIRMVTIDMSEFLASVVRTCLPGRIVVIDHCHVKAWINAYFDDHFRKATARAIMAAALESAAAQGISDKKDLAQIRKKVNEEVKKLRDHRFSLMKLPANRNDQDRLNIERFCLPHEILEKGTKEKDALLAIWDEAEDSTRESGRGKQLDSGSANTTRRNSDGQSKPLQASSSGFGTKLENQWFHSGLALECHHSGIEPRIGGRRFASDRATRAFSRCLPARAGSPLDERSLL